MGIYVHIILSLILPLLLGPKIHESTPFTFVECVNMCEFTCKFYLY